MYNFLVLGLIPGTNIQITFAMWAETAALFFMIHLFIRERKRSIPGVLAEDRDHTVALQPLED